METILKKRLVLASNSPRRIALLKTLGHHFDVIPHNIEECFPDNFFAGGVSSESGLFKGI